MARYRNDPYWVTAKYPGTSRNGVAFKAGDRVLFYPTNRTILAGEQAEAEMRAFEAAAADEDGGY